MKIFVSFKLRNLCITQASGNFPLNNKGIYLSRFQETSHIWQIRAKFTSPHVYRKIGRVLLHLLYINIHVQEVHRPQGEV